MSQLAIICIIVGIIFVVGLITLGFALTRLARRLAIDAWVTARRKLRFRPNWPDQQFRVDDG